MPFKPLLYIYDADDEDISGVVQAADSIRLDSKAVGVSGGVKGLVSAMDRLVNEKWFFPRVVFFTHGNIGRIFFNHESINRHGLTKIFANRGYEKLFPVLGSRMYFNGCNVAEDDEGWSFLETAASIFLRSMGGVAFGDTSKGYFMRPALPFLLLTSPLTYYITFAGKSYHPSGTTRYVFVGPGGDVVKREED